jgi:poly-gamma-glutamate synthesis protein (capsule biosynthesis protein)
MIPRHFRIFLAFTALIAMLAVVRLSASRTQVRTLHLVAVGDILLGDAAQPLLDRKGYDFPFQHLRPYLKNADVLVGNLEGSVTERKTPFDAHKRWSYKSSPAAAVALQKAGFAVLDLANNHAMDYGPEGLADTMRFLDKNRIRHFGAGASSRQAGKGKVVNAGGCRIGFLGFFEATDRRLMALGWFADATRAGVAPMKQGEVRQAIRKLRPRVNLLVVSFHWGRNYEPVTRFQKRWGRRAVDDGADLVLGHHPHVAQGVEVYRGVPILYSLGNFTFGTKGRFQKVDQRWRYGWIADIAIQGNRLSGLDLIPIEVDNRKVHYQPRPAGAKVLERLVPFLNRDFNAPLKVQGDRVHLQVSRE